MWWNVWPAPSASGFLRARAPLAFPSMALADVLQSRLWVQRCRSDNSPAYPLGGRPAFGGTAGHASGTSQQALGCDRSPAGLAPCRSTLRPSSPMTTTSRRAPSCHRSSRPRCSPSPPTTRSSDAIAGRSRRPIYSRGDNPTVAVFEAKLAALEGAEAARGFRERHGRDQRGRAELPQRRRPHGLRPPRLPGRVPAVQRPPAALRHPGRLRRRPRRRGRRARAARRQGCSISRARPAWCSRPRTWPRLAAARAAEGAISIVDNSLGDADLPAAARARRRPGAALGLEISRRPQRHRRGRGRGPARADRADQAERLSLSRRQARRRSRPGCWCAACARCRCACAGITTSALEIAERLARHPRVVRVIHPPARQRRPRHRHARRHLRPVLLRARRRHGGGAPLLRRAAGCSSSASAGAATRAWSFPLRSGCEQKAEANPLRAFGVRPRSVRLHIGLEDPGDLWSDLAAGARSLLGNSDRALELRRRHGHESIADQARRWLRSRSPRWPCRRPTPR